MAEHHDHKEINDKKIRRSPEYRGGKWMARWTIYYSDKIILTQEDMAWEDCPSSGVRMIMEHLDNGRAMSHMGQSYYFMRGSTIISCSLMDIHDHLQIGISSGNIKFGNLIRDEVWDRVHEIVFGSST